MEIKRTAIAVAGLLCAGVPAYATYGHDWWKYKDWYDHDEPDPNVELVGSGKNSWEFVNLISQYCEMEAVVEVASGDGKLPSDETSGCWVWTYGGWKWQTTTTVTDSPHELAFLDPDGGYPYGVVSEEQYGWKDKWSDYYARTDWVDFSVKLVDDSLVANLGGVELTYSIDPLIKIDALAFWIVGNDDDYIKFDGTLNGYDIEVTDSGSDNKWFLYEIDEEFEELVGQVKIGGWCDYPTDSVSMMLKFFGCPVPEPSEVALAGIGGLAALVLVRRRRKVRGNG